MNIKIFMKNRLLAESLRDRLISQNQQYVIAINDNPFPVQSTIDLVLTDGNRNCQSTRDQHPEARFILVDPGYSDEEITFLLLGYHFDGILSPDFDPALLEKALNTVHGGRFWLEQRHLKGLIYDHRTRDCSKIVDLTQKERRIVSLISQGMRNREIAEELCLCEQTIKGQVSKI